MFATNRVERGNPRLTRGQGTLIRVSRGQVTATPNVFLQYASKLYFSFFENVFLERFS